MIFERSSNGNDPPRREAPAPQRIGGQLTEVIVLPQRGQSVFRPAQVVPQLEQVQQPLVGEVVPQAYVALPTAPETVAVLVPVPPHAGTSSNAQDDCGNSGKLKNSSCPRSCRPSKSDYLPATDRPEISSEGLPKQLEDGNPNRRSLPTASTSLSI